MGSRVQSTVDCFPELLFLQISVEQALVGFLKQFINNFIFPTLACVALFNNNIYKEIIGEFLKVNGEQPYFEK